MSVVAFIPLRGGGKRIGLINGLDKERAPLGGPPLMAWTIKAATESKVFSKVYSVTASNDHATLAEKFGAKRFYRRPEWTAADDSPDIDWVSWALKMLEDGEGLPDAFAILRVTSPFRTAFHIREAWKRFFRNVGVDSLRTVRKVSEHPGKMWVIRQGKLLPLLPIGEEKEPWHSRATQQNFECYVQTAGMEFAWSEMVLKTGTIAGSTIIPYVLEGEAALDINTLLDWKAAEEIVRNAKR